MAVKCNHFTTDPSDVDISMFIHNNVDDIREQLDSAVKRHTSIKHYATMDVQFYRKTIDNKLQHTTARFRVSPNVRRYGQRIHVVC